MPEILEAIVERIPPPRGQHDQPLRALIFDSHYDAYKGVIAYIRVFDGVLTSGARILLMGTGVEVETLELGAFRPGMTPLAIRMSARRNGVSRLHGEVSRKMWRPLFPESVEPPITSCQ